MSISDLEEAAKVAREKWQDAGRRAANAGLDALLEIPTLAAGRAAREVWFATAVFAVERLVDAAARLTEWRNAEAAILAAAKQEATNNA